MGRFCLAKLAVCAGILSFSQLSFAAAFQFYELGTPIIGTAGVGQAVTDDASIAYFNPAGMTALPSSAFMLGSQILLPYSNFSPSSANTITGNNGGSAAVLAPAIGAYFVYHPIPCLSFGLSLTSPYGGAFNYDDHWVGRYVVQQLMLYTIDLNPVIAYQANDWLSLGVGFVLEYANLFQTVALPLDPIINGQASIKVDSFSPGFNLGALITPSPATKIGVAFRSQIVHHLHGNTSFLNISNTPSTHTKMVMPTNVIASISQEIYGRFTLLGEVGWSHWSSMRNTILTIDQFSVVTPNHWHDTYRVGAGAKFRCFEPLLLQAGISYDSSPVSSSRRLPDLPVDRQIRVGGGLEYSLVQAATLGLSYEYINLGKAKINTLTTQGKLAGSYSRNYANVFQISLNVNCF